MDDFDDDDDNDLGEEVFLKYEISTNHVDKSVHLSFKGFENEDQLEYFKDFIERSIPLILHNGTMQ